MRDATAIFSLTMLLAIGHAQAADLTVYGTGDADPRNDLPCYRLTLGPMLDADGNIEMDSGYGGSGFILRARHGTDCTRFRGEAAYDDDHSFFIDLTMDPTCRVPLHFRAELKARHEPQGESFGAALCKKLRRSRDQL